MSNEIHYMNEMIGLIDGNAFDTARRGIRKMRIYVKDNLLPLCEKEFANNPQMKHEIEEDFQKLRLALNRAEHYAYRAGEYLKPIESSRRLDMKKNGIHYCKEARGILEKINKEEKE